MAGTVLPTAIVTIFGTIFLAELADKDALLLLSLATKEKPSLAFAAGSIAFTATTAVIVLAGSVLVSFVPVPWIRAGGGCILLGYAVYLAGSSLPQAGKGEASTKNPAAKTHSSGPATLLAMILPLMLLDLAGDATEVLTIVFVAQFKDALLVFASAATALVAASGAETLFGNVLRRVLSEARLRYLSIAVTLVVGGLTLASALFSL